VSSPIEIVILGSTGSIGVQALEIIEAILESSKLGKIVIVPPLISESYANK
jgi:1-deoxy-D-xylulose 5-phosphate reductoisomerase